MMLCYTTSITGQRLNFTKGRYRPIQLLYVVWFLPTALLAFISSKSIAVPPSRRRNNFFLERGNLVSIKHRLNSHYKILNGGCPEEVLRKLNFVAYWPKLFWSVRCEFFSWSYLNVEVFEHLPRSLKGPNAVIKSPKSRIDFIILSDCLLLSNGIALSVISEVKYYWNTNKYLECIEKNLSIKLTIFLFWGRINTNISMIVNIHRGRKNTYDNEQLLSSIRSKNLYNSIRFCVCWKINFLRNYITDHRWLE